MQASNKVFAFALLLAGAEVAASQEVSPLPYASATGVAVDSIRGGYLHDALISIDGTQRIAITDSLGRFHLDSIPPGRHSLRMRHALLDTLALSIVSPPAEFVAGGDVSFVIAIPSPSTIVARKCSAEDRNLGKAAITGVVSDADTDAPANGAKVIVDWVEVVLGTKSLNRTPKRREAEVRADGSYFLCGIPDDLATGVLATRGRDSTAAVPVSFTNFLVVQSFHLPITTQSTVVPATEPGKRPRGAAVVTGTVNDSRGEPIAAARIALEADDVVALSDAKGAFRLGGLRAGTRLLSVRKLGYEATELPVELHSQNAVVATVVMPRLTQLLETVKVRALRELGLERVGFASRKKSGAGRYLSPDDLDRRNSPRLNDLLREVPSLRSGRTADGQSYVTGRFGDCVRYFVDGHLWSNASGSPDTFISGREIGAVEVYGALGAPAEYMSFGLDGRTCSSVVVWTRWKLRI